MKNMMVATAQFEHRSGDKQFNLAVIRKMAGEAAAKGAKVIAFHECSISGYTFARTLSKEQMLDLAEVLLGDELVIAEVTPERRVSAGGHRYIQARRPELYKDIIGQPHQSEQKVVWMGGGKS